MAFGELGRIALEVDDLEAFAGDLDKLFGMKLHVTDKAIESHGLLAGVGHDGIELVQRAVPNPEMSRYWKPPLAAVILAVDDLEEAGRRMAEAGIELVHTVVTGSGFRELFYGDNFHGIPLVLYQKDEAHLVEIDGEGEIVIDTGSAGA